jgi:class 3 adenylate cyclase
VIADADDDLVGDVLNTAARLEAQCTPGEVLVGEDTWRLTRGAIDYERSARWRSRASATASPRINWSRTTSAPT